MNYVFHDFETFNFSPIGGSPSQWAAIKTNSEFSQEGETNVFCKTYKDTLPEIEACLVTKHSPNSVNNGENSFCEFEFAQNVHRFITQSSNTTIIGYNSLSFDDEWLRQMFYRNLLPAYDWHFANNNSRYDGLLLLRAVFALRPHLLEWPFVVDKDDETKSRVSLKLENLSKANNLEHLSAHDALSDVVVLKQLMSIIKEKDPDFFELALNVKNKHYIRALMEKEDSKKGLLYISNFESEHNFVGFVIPLFPSSDPNVYWAWDAKVDPQTVLSLSNDDKKNLMIMKKDEMQALGLYKKGLVKIKLNSLPNLFPKTAYDKSLAGDNGLAEIKKDISHNISVLNGCMDDIKSLVALIELNKPVYEEKQDYECALYSGGFITNEEKKFSQVFLAKGDWESRYIHVKNHCPTARMEALSLRLIGRNCPSVLNEEDAAEWLKYLKQRYEAKSENMPTPLDKSSPLTISENILKLDNLLLEHNTDSEEYKVISEVLGYYKSLSL